MKIKVYLATFFIIGMIGQGFGQITYPYYKAKIETSNGAIWEGILLQVSDTSLLITPTSNWKRIKGEVAKLENLLPLLKPYDGGNWNTATFTYSNIVAIDVKGKRKGLEFIPISAGGGGFLMGALFAQLKVHYDYDETPIEERHNKRRDQVLTGLGYGIIGGLIGAGIGTIVKTAISGAITKRETIIEYSDIYWQRQLVQYSILK